MPGRLGSGIDEERPGSAPASPYPLPPRVRPAEGDSTPAGFLAAVPMFAGLSAPLRRQIAAQARSVRLEAGEWLFRQGDAEDSLYVVRSGRLEVVVEEPRAAVVRALTRGAVVGELALLTREPRSASVRARRDSELLRVSSTDFAELLSHEPTVLARADARARAPAPREPRARAAGAPPARHDRDRARRRGAGYGRSRSACVQRSPPRHRDAARRGGDGGEDATGRASTAPSASTSASDARTGGAGAVERLLPAPGRPDPAGRGAGRRRPARLAAGCDVDAERPRQRAARGRMGARDRSPRALHWLMGRRNRQGHRRLARRLAGRSVGSCCRAAERGDSPTSACCRSCWMPELMIDRVGGCSMGAFVGAMFAMGMSPAEIQRALSRGVREAPAVGRLRESRPPRCCAATARARCWCGRSARRPRSRS